MNDTCKTKKKKFNQLNSSTRESLDIKTTRSKLQRTGLHLQTAFGHCGNSKLEGKKVSAKLGNHLSWYAQLNCLRTLQSLESLDYDYKITALII